MLNFNMFFTHFNLVLKFSHFGHITNFFYFNEPKNQLDHRYNVTLRLLQKKEMTFKQTSFNKLKENDSMIT